MIMIDIDMLLDHLNFNYYIMNYYYIIIIITYNYIINQDDKPIDNNPPF